MNSDGGSDEPPPPPQEFATTNGGEFLLHLLQQQQQQQTTPFHTKTPSESHHNPSIDPAVAAVGPAVSIPNHHCSHHQLHLQQPYSSLSPQNPNFSLQGFSQTTPHCDLLRHRFESDNSRLLSDNFRLQLELELELKKQRELGLGYGTRIQNGFDPNHMVDPRVNLNFVHGSPQQRQPGPPPGFAGKPANQWRVGGELNNVRRDNASSSSSDVSNYGGFRKDVEREKTFLSRDNGIGLGRQLDNPGLPTGSALPSVPGSEVEESLMNLRGGNVENGVSFDEVGDLSEQLVDSVLGEDVPEEKTESSAKKKYARDQDFRSDARGKWILPQRMRNSRRLIECRRDIDRLNAPFLLIYESLIPAEEEKTKQKQLLTLLEKLVCNEWPNARLFVYGSCANSFGVSKSDIDICLAINDRDINKSELLLKLAEILKAENLQNVQALIRARVPIVKLTDPLTGISCDICVNNVLAVVNTKLLRDYAGIDVRLRQLAYLVKHWAKTRRVNETYQGTLSSYAYVLMCIHFLQQRNPPILPCLQSMKTTYTATVDDIQCAFFDQVEALRDFGARNKEKIGHLLWAFFNYWAYSHDYANNVISVRTGSILSKHEKDWTRRIGNDRHLICIEDPFETSHDLGRVVDKHSIRVLREEFERAAEIMQYDPNCCVPLFEPYIPPSPST